MFHSLRIDSDPTTWELTTGVQRAPTSDNPVVLPVYHPLLGNLVLSPRSMGSAVFLDYQLPPDPNGTRPNGALLPAPALYLPSPIGPDVHANPPNLYIPLVDLAVLLGDIIAAMKDATLLPVEVTGGEVVINGADVPFAVLCPSHAA